jgi:hypothetical protein
MPGRARRLPNRGELPDEVQGLRLGMLEFLHHPRGTCMRVLIATAIATTLAAVAAAAMAWHLPRQWMGPFHAAPKEAVPGLVWRNGTATLRLTDRPCASESLALALQSEGVGKPRTYEVVQGSRRYTGCWVKDMAGDVVTAEPGREIAEIPIAWFRRS